MNPEAQVIFNTILAKLNKSEVLTSYECSFLRARRSYLSPRQRLRYGDILYFNKQLLFYKTKTIGIFLVRFSKGIIIGIIASLIALFLARN